VSCNDTSYIHLQQFELSSVNVPSAFGAEIAIGKIKKVKITMNFSRNDPSK
jgi:hypothetical protein